MQVTKTGQEIIDKAASDLEARECKTCGLEVLDDPESDGLVMCKDHRGGQES